MANSLWPSLIGLLILVVLLGLLLLTWKSPESNLKLRESLFRNLGVPYRNLIGLLLGATASLLPLTSETWTISVAIWVFAVALTLTMFLLIAVRPNPEKESDRFSWGLLAIIILGFGFGALLYQSRSWWIWLWNKYLLINEPHELLLEALFLLGVILGVFVVRNWAKEDKAFVESLSGVLGGTFIATVLGKVQEGLTPLRAIAYYALGFTLSGTLNLLFAARLTAKYTNKHSITSRALLDFLYGSERTKIIDGYFLKNFEEDPNYAKRFLKDTLLEYRNLVRREFAEKMNRRMIKRVPERTTPELNVECEGLRSDQDEKEQLHFEIKAFPAKPDPTQLDVKQSKEARLTTIDRLISDREAKLKPIFFYELFGIECEARKPDVPDAPSGIQDMDREYDVIYKRLDAKSPIQEDMFRVGVAIRHQDVLEYIVSPGQYLASFPYFGSVAGLSLIVRQTIIMDRDKTKKFRSKDYRDGICPRDIEQWRGLDEIDFLSYVSIPIVSRLGHSTENTLGVVNIDTKIFVTQCELDGHAFEANPGMFRKRLTPRQLNEYASKLYDQEDEVVKYIEKLTRIIEPVLELYSKCRVGAI